MEFPHDLLPGLAGLGIAGLQYEGEGCHGRSSLLDGMVAMELARADPSIAPGSVRSAPMLASVPARLRPAPAGEVAAALVRRRAGELAPGDERLLVRHFLAVLTRAAPGASVEVRVPPHAVAQCVTGARHTRGTPPAVVETDPETWIAMATGGESWTAAVDAGRVLASGERSDLSALLPLPAPRGVAG